MISVENTPLNNVESDDDFTLESYRLLIRMALDNYQPASYRSVPWGRQFILWRHDCDFSLNRALVLAKVEAEEGLRTTFFINPHCEFYNLLERNQLEIVKEIISLGHDIGLHFDAAFFNTTSESELSQQVTEEADLLEKILGLRPGAFSFHNPMAFHLTCEQESYGGLLNCYSKRFKTEVPYCSDSNGYWRFRRLYDVLRVAEDACLQVLTHPGWWQDKAMSPRRRIFRAVYGRASSLISKNDELLSELGREQLSVGDQPFSFLETVSPNRFKFYDYLWNMEEYQALFIELGGLYFTQMLTICKVRICKEWKISSEDVNTFFDDLQVDSHSVKLFEEVFDKNWQIVSGQSKNTHQNWMKLFNRVVHGKVMLDNPQAEKGCVYLCDVIKKVGEWGLQQSVGHNGLVKELPERLDENSVDIAPMAVKQSKHIKRGDLNLTKQQWNLLKTKILTNIDEKS